jgi:hypothetical protein
MTIQVAEITDTHIFLPGDEIATDFMEEVEVCTYW